MLREPEHRAQMRRPRVVPRRDARGPEHARSDHPRAQGPLPAKISSSSRREPAPPPSTDARQAAVSRVNSRACTWRSRTPLRHRIEAGHESPVTVDLIPVAEVRVCAGSRASGRPPRVASRPIQRVGHDRPRRAITILPLSTSIATSSGAVEVAEPDALWGETSWAQHLTPARCPRPRPAEAPRGRVPARPHSASTTSP